MVTNKMLWGNHITRRQIMIRHLDWEKRISLKRVNQFKRFASPLLRRTLIQNKFQVFNQINLFILMRKIGTKILMSILNSKMWKLWNNQRTYQNIVRALKSWLIAKSLVWALRQIELRIILICCKNRYSLSRNWSKTSSRN